MAAKKQVKGGKSIRASKVKRVKNNNNEPERQISKMQDLQLQMLAQTTHNNLDGKKLDRLLRKNHHLWRAVMITGNNLFPLRDLEMNMWSADTLHILVREGYEDQLEEFVRENFAADEWNWIGGNQALEMLGYWEKGIENNPKLVLSAWWD